MQEIDTRSMLFICGGAFVGLDKIIQQRTNTKGVGFGSAVATTKDDTEIYQKVIPKDIIQFGFIPEFVGRFGMITNVDELTVENLVRVLLEPKNSIVRQYQYIFELDGIRLEFEDDALSLIAEKAKDLKTNARGLKNIIEKILLPYQFDAVNLVDRGLSKIVISKDTVSGNAAIMIFDKKTKNEQK